MREQGLRLAFRLAARDLRGGLKGFRVFLACLALGVGAIALIGSVSQAIVSGLAADGQKLLGGDVALRLIHRGVSEEQRNWLRANGDLSQMVSMRSMARTGDGKRTLINLKAVDKSYPLYGEVVFNPNVTPEQAFGLRDGAWGAAVKPPILSRLGLKIGDRVTVGRAIFQIRALLEKEPDPIGGVRAITLGPRFLVSEDSLAATGLVTRGAQITFEYRLRLPPETDLTLFRETLDAAFPEAGWRVRDRTGATVGVERFINRTTQFVTLVALTALLIGGVGAGNAARSYMAGKTGVIATLKCLGAAQGLIFRIYLIEMALMAALGTLIGVAIGALIPLASAAALSEVLPVPLKAGIYPIPLLLAGAFGILTALVFSLWPLARACKTPPGTLFRSLILPGGAAPGLAVWIALALSITALGALAIATAQDKLIASWFVGGSIAAFIIFHLAGKLVMWIASKINAARGTELRLALANLHRPGAQTGNVVLSVGMGLTVLVAVMVVEANIGRQLAESLPERAPDYYFIDIQPNQTEEFDRTVRAAGGLRDLDRVPMLRGRIMKVNGVDARKVKVAENKRWVLRNDRGLTWSRHPPRDAAIVAGEWWPQGYDGPPLVSFDAGAAVAMGVGVGDTLTVDVLGRPITARISSLRLIRWGNLGINFVLIFSPGVIEKAPQTHIATVRTARDATADIEKIVTDRFRNVTAVKVRDVLDTLTGLMERIAGAIRAAAGITLLAGVLVLGGAIAATHRRRVYDAVILKVLGARRRQVLTAFLLEYGLMAGATAILAAIIGSLAGWAIVTQVMRAEWAPVPETVLATVAGAAILVIFAGLIGTWQALGRKAAPLLRND